MDSGSQCSYITSKACRKLGLKSLGTKSMSILTFGSRNERLTDCNVVKLGIRLKDGTHTELKLLSVEHICEPIVSAAVDLDQYLPFNSLDFAFDFKHFVEIEPDILLGSDQYWSLLTGELIKSTSGPVALNTHLGWIFSGPVSVH